MDQALQCETQMRALFTSHSLALESIPQLASDISLVNQSIAANGDLTYEATQDDDQQRWISLGSSYLETDGGKSREVEYTLALPDDNVKAARTLTVDIKLIQNDGLKHSNTEITQTYNLDEACNRRLISTNKEVTQGMTGGDNTDTSVTYYLDGTNDQKSGHFTLPANTVLINYMPDFKADNLKANVKYYNYELETGLLPVTLSDLNDAAISVAGLNASFKRMKASIGGVDAAVGYTQGLNIAYLDMLGQRQWDLPQAQWNAIHLSGTTSSPEFAHSELPKDYLYSHDTIQIVTDKSPSYPHFSAYWTTQSATQDTMTNEQILTVRETSPPTYSDQATAADLVSNGTIQTDLSIIQNAAQSIMARASDRRDRVQAILEWLAANYTYDFSMVEDGTVRSLTTEQALSTRAANGKYKGVCQHYAVVFTALARAMQIPSRIVFGYFIGTTLDAHAWVEAEVEPGLWQVIEPQEPDALTNMHTRFYYPIARAMFLEDQTVKSYDTDLTLTSEVFTVKPAAP